MCDQVMNKNTPAEQNQVRAVEIELPYGSKRCPSRNPDALHGNRRASRRPWLPSDCGSSYTTDSYLPDLFLGDFLSKVERSNFAEAGE
jgi:hypothetical protein